MSDLAGCRMMRCDSLRCGVSNSLYTLYAHQRIIQMTLEDNIVNASPQRKSNSQYCLFAKNKLVLYNLVSKEARNCPASDQR